MALVGADVGALRALARTLSQAADRLDQTNSAVSGGLSNVRWSGPDADRFGAVWQQQSRKSLSSAATALREAAQALQRNALEQEQASAATGGALPGSTGSGSAMPSVAGRPLVGSRCSIRSSTRETSSIRLRCGRSPGEPYLAARVSRDWI